MLLPIDLPVFCLTLPLCSSHWLEFFLHQILPKLKFHQILPKKQKNNSELTWIFVLGRAASALPPSLALYLIVKVSIGVVIGFVTGIIIGIVIDIVIYIVIYIVIAIVIAIVVSIGIRTAQRIG